MTPSHPMNCLYGFGFSDCMDEQPAPNLRGPFVPTIMKTLFYNDLFSYALGVSLCCNQINPFRCRCGDVFNIFPNTQRPASDVAEKDALWLLFAIDDDVATGYICLNNTFVDFLNRSSVQVQFKSCFIVV